MAAPPLISVVIPCHNHGRFLHDAVGSVFASQERPVEVLVVDDGSTDDTARVARGLPGVRLLAQENLGLARARNRGLQEAAGEFVVFLDADDRLAPGALDIGMAAMRSHPESAFVSGRCATMSMEGELLPTSPQPRVEKDHYLEMLKRNYLWTPGVVLFRRTAVEAAGGFDPSVNAAADYALYLRITRTQAVFDHAVIVAHYRQHATSMSRNASRMLGESLAVLRREAPYVRGHAEREAAFRSGIEMWQDFYGTHLVNEIRAHLHAGEWIRASRKALVLGRLHPRGLIHHGWRKATLALRGRSGASA